MWWEREKCARAQVMEAKEWWVEWRQEVVVMGSGWW
jgi:hypothetical protein